MASHVQVILKTDVESLGNQGDLIRVRPGHARNFLIPRGLAVAATRQNRNVIEHEQRLAQARLEKEREVLRKQAQTIEGLVVHVAKEAGDEGKLFGSVTAAEVAEAFERQGITVDRKKIEMPDEAIKSTGSYDLRLKLGRGVYGSFKLQVKTKS